MAGEQASDDRAYRPILPQPPALDNHSAVVDPRLIDPCLVDPRLQQPGPVIFGQQNAGVVPNQFNPPVTMGDQPYRTISYIQQDPNPSASLTLEQYMDLRLCISALSPDQCREVINGLENYQIKNAVYDRVLCYPNDEFTNGLRKGFVQRVNSVNQIVINFLGHYNHVQETLGKWKNVAFLVQGAYEQLETDIKCYLGPSIDSIGVHSTRSDYILTKRNGLTTLVDIGFIMLDIPAFNTAIGRSALKYDGLSRAVGNILHSAANPQQRQQLLEHGIEESLMRLEQHAKEAGIFPNLSKALSTDPALSSDLALKPYWFPEIQPEPQPQPQPRQTGNKRKAKAKNTEPAKRRKRNTKAQQGNNNLQQGIVNPHQENIHPYQGIVNPQQGVYNPQQGIVNPQQGIYNPQQGIVNPQQGIVSHQQHNFNPQQGAFNQQQGIISQEQGIVNPQQGVFHQQEGSGHSQQGTNDHQQGFTVPAQDNASFQHGITEPQQDTANSQQGNVNLPGGTIYAQDGTTVLDPTQIPPEGLSDPSMWDTWWPRPEQSSGEEPSTGFDANYAAGLLAELYNGSHNTLSSATPTTHTLASATPTTNTLSSATSTTGQANDHFLDTCQQPGPSGSGTGQEAGQADGTQQQQEFSQEKLLAEELRAAAVQFEQDLGLEQMVLAQQMGSQLAPATAPQVQQHQGFQQNMAAQPMVVAQNYEQHQSMDQNAYIQYAGYQVQRNQGNQQNMPVQYAAQQGQPHQGLQQNVPAQSPYEQVQPQQGLQQNVTAQPAAAKKARKPRASRKKDNQTTKDKPVVEAGRENVELSLYNHTPASFEDVTREIFDQMSREHVGKTPQMQVYMAPVVAKRIENGVTQIQNRIEKVVKHYKNKEVLLKSQEYALGALLWIVQACAIDQGGTVLSAEVARQLRRDHVVHAIWSCVRIASAEEMKRLLQYCEPESDVTAEVKLDAIIKTMKNVNVTGWENLQYVLDEMRKMAGMA